MSGREYEEEAGISWFYYTDLSINSRIEIRYDPADPSVSKVEQVFRDREHEGGMQAVFAFLLFMIVVGALWLAGWYFTAFRPLWRLMRQGRTLRGEVVACSGSAGEDDYQVSLAYRFTTPDGKLIEGQAEAQRNDLAKAVLPAANTPVMVYYVDATNHAVL